jgi:hypothetical protein
MQHAAPSGLRWLPTAAARVQSRIWTSGICGGQSGAGTGFLRVLRFPLPIFIPPIAPQSPSLIIWGWYNRPEVAALQGLSPTPLAIKKMYLVAGGSSNHDFTSYPSLSARCTRIQGFPRSMKKETATLTEHKKKSKHSMRHND